MDPNAPSLLADLPKLLGLVIALAGVTLAATIWWRRHRSATVANMLRARASGGIVYQDAPTVRVVDSQRVDRIRKVVRLAAGEHVDILDSRGAPLPRFRVTVKEIIQGDAPAARVLVEYGGTTLSCGPTVKELGVNDFLLPRAARDESRSSIHYFHERGDALDFMRIKLRSVDPPSRTAEIDVMQVSGNWPAV